MSTAAEKLKPARAHEPLRFITAASLFDGHDAAVNIIRRLIQAQGAEVIHLGHNRSVAEIVRAAIQEDADAIACTSYQGGHNEYFRYMVDMLKEYGAQHIRIVLGGGGTIAPEEVSALEAYGVEKIYTPDDGMQLGLVGMIEDVFDRVRSYAKPQVLPANLAVDDHRSLAAAISLYENGDKDRLSQALKKLKSHNAAAPVLGITGTGGAGKSSLTDELLSRFLEAFPDRHVAVVAVDPTRRRTGGALLGDRIRMNSLANERIFMRSLATRRQHLATSEVLGDSVDLLKHAGFDLVIVETAGIGQSDSEIVDLCDLSLYVMTSEYGAQSQLEKIDMLDYADFVVLNKFEKRGAEDALTDVKKQWRRNRVAFDMADDAIPVYPAIASRFNDPGVNRLFVDICKRIAKDSNEKTQWDVALEISRVIKPNTLIPSTRLRYLAEIANNGRQKQEDIEQFVQAARRAQQSYEALKLLGDNRLADVLQPYAHDAIKDNDGSVQTLRQAYNDALEAIGRESLEMLRSYQAKMQAARDENYSYEVRGKAIRGSNYSQSLTGLAIPKLATPQFEDWGEQLRFLLKENLPGGYPYTGGVYPYRRENEDPTRMFAGEGMPERTNRRFHYLAAGHAATRLSTAFDSVTLYGEDPDPRPDIYGRIGNSGVSIATLDDMKKLYSGFDLCANTTSVSMTINGPAPMILAMFLNTAIDQQVERYLKEQGKWSEAERQIEALFEGKKRPQYHGDLPKGNDGFGLAMLGVTGDQLLPPDVYQKIKASALKQVRGTVQADILKEDQAQNTCIFSTEFALRLMGDVQAYFIDHGVRNFYSVSVSGYHIAEAGANPVTQLAFTLANGFTIVEYYLARGMSIDDFAPNLSFFFSNGMDPEYAVIGRVARRIWARAMRDLYQAGSRSQMMKYHIQTSGRSLHAQEIQFNDIRTTLQAMYALFDNCNSLHTNAFDEAVTTPTEDSVRRAMAIQLIINRELGLNQNQNPWQGSFVIDYLTDLVEEAVYQEFERIADRGGVLGAMENMYQRNKIQEESMIYEGRKHDGSLPIVGVNTFKPVETQEENHAMELIRSTEEEKALQVENTLAFHALHSTAATKMVGQLKTEARNDNNVFAVLMDAVKHCSLGQISNALYQVGGRYRRHM